MAADSILTTVREYLDYDPTHKVILEPIARGASGRTIVRIKTEEYEPFIGIEWTDERPDNDFYPPVAHFLEKIGIPVAGILHENLAWRTVLVEDLGDTDLLSLKEKPYQDRKPYYESALQQLDKLFYARSGRDQTFNPPFDANLYRWEQEYFCEYFVEELMGLDPGTILESSAFTDLANRLGQSAKHLVHRDFQSQNLMLLENKTWWIDFQGMRRGRQEYDLASLIFDPYMNHSEADRHALLDLWEDISEDRPAEKIFREVATQRLMQSLGAYGNIIENHEIDWYRQHVPTAAKLLLEITAGTDLADPLAPALEKACETF